MNKLSNVAETDCTDQEVDNKTHFPSGQIDTLIIDIAGVRDRYMLFWMVPQDMIRLTRQRMAM